MKNVLYAIALFVCSVTFAQMAKPDMPLFLAMITEDGSVELSWTTQNVYSTFIIERSSDGTSFYDLFRVANISKNQNNFFSIKDHAPLKGLSYYRVRQATDNPKDKPVYSDVEKVIIKSPGNINVTKNYRTGNYQIDFASSAPNTYKFEILSSNQQAIYTDELVNFEGNYSKEIDLVSKGKDIYYIVVTGKEEKITKRLVVY